METHCWLALPVAGCWVTAQGCVCRLCGDLNNGLAAHFQWRKCALEVSCTWDALYQSTYLPFFTFYPVLQCYNLAVFRAGTRSDEVFQDLPGVSCRVFDAGRRPLQTGCPVPQQHPRRRRNAVESRTACDACATCKQVFCVTVWDIVNVARLRRSGTCKLRGLMSSGFLVRGVGGFDGWGGGSGRLRH